MTAQAGNLFLALVFGANEKTPVVSVGYLARAGYDAARKMFNLPAFVIIDNSTGVEGNVEPLFIRHHGFRLDVR